MLLSGLFLFATICYGAASPDFDCGIVASQGAQLKRAAGIARAGEVPWHAGIYSKETKPYKQLCGGTLVRATAVISAAHCLWSPSENTVNPATNYAVAVGKLNRPWDEPVDSYAQKSNVREISIPLRFRGPEANFQDDISVLKLETPIQFNTFVRPVCIDFDYNFEKYQLAPGKLGKIAAWSIPDGGSADRGEALQVFEFAYNNIEQCFDKVPTSFRNFITSDKFCAFGEDSSQVLCRGGSGGGLSFPSVERGVTRHYMRGVASTAPTTNSTCSQFVAYTHISKHREFIQKHV